MGTLPVRTVGLLLLALTTPAKAEYALAWGHDGKRWAFGTNTNSSTAEAAREKALEGCALKACRIVLSGAGVCVALAVGRDGSAGWATAETTADAEQLALKSCGQSSRKCKVSASFCDTFGRAAETPPVPAEPATPGAASSFAAALKARLRTCINVGGASFSTDDTVRLTLGLDDRGKLAFPPAISAVGSGANAGLFATRLIVALDRCAPYGALSGAQTATWSNTQIEFSPRDFR